MRASSTGQLQTATGSTGRFERLRLAVRRSVSTRLRILGWFILLMALAMAFALFIQRSILLAQMNDDINAQLRQEVDEVTQLSTGRNPATGAPFGDDVRAIFETFLRRNVPVAGEGLFTIVDGRPFASTVAPAQLLEDEAIVARWAAVETPTQQEIDTPAGPARYLAVPVTNSAGEIAGVFVVAIFLEERRADVNRVINTGALVFGSTFVVASVLAWFAAGRALRPVGMLTRTARTISDSHWTERIPVDGNDELAELATTFNDMLDRLESAFSLQRRFIDDAGHELRTPITIIRGHLELLATDDAATQEAHRLVLDELDRMSRLVDDLLLMARAEQPDFLDVHPLDVAELVEEVVAKAAPLADRDIALGSQANVVIDADRQRLTQALMNLIRNAVEHTPDGTIVTAASVATTDAVELTVSDNGPGIAPEEQARIFERFARGPSGRRRTEGAGLGLAIVRVIAEAHGGSVRVESSPAGTTFTIALPAQLPESEDGTGEEEEEL